MTVYEYRVMTPGRHFPTVAEVFRSDEPVWQSFEGRPKTDEDYADTTGLTGVLGLVEATCREEEARGRGPVIVQRRVVGEWEPVSRSSLEASA